MHDGLHEILEGMDDEFADLFGHEDESTEKRGKKQDDQPDGHKTGKTGSEKKDE